MSESPTDGAPLLHLEGISVRFGAGARAVRALEDTAAVYRQRLHEQGPVDVDLVGGAEHEEVARKQKKNSKTLQFEAYKDQRNK